MNGEPKLTTGETAESETGQKKSEGEVVNSEVNPDRVALGQISEAIFKRREENRPF